MIGPANYVASDEIRYSSKEVVEKIQTCHSVLLLNRVTGEQNVIDKSRLWKI